MNSQFTPSIVISLFSVHASFSSALMNAVKMDNGTAFMLCELAFAVFLGICLLISLRAVSKATGPVREQDHARVLKAVTAKPSSKSKDAMAADGYVANLVEKIEEVLKDSGLGKFPMFGKKRHLRNILGLADARFQEAFKANEGFKKSGSALPKLRSDRSFDQTVTRNQEKLRLIAIEIEQAREGGLGRKTVQSIRRDLEGLANQIRDIWAA